MPRTRAAPGPIGLTESSLSNYLHFPSILLISEKENDIPCILLQLVFSTFGDNEIGVIVISLPRNLKIISLKQLLHLNIKR